MRHSLFRKWLIRAWRTFLLVAVIVGGGIAAYDYSDYFRSTSYLFVGMFLFLILVSNLLARLVDSFINA